MTADAGGGTSTLVMSTSAHVRGNGSLPVDRAFVVQLEADADLATGRLGGRVEHVVSGRATRFRSALQLLSFLGGTFSLRPDAARATASSAPAKPHRRARGDDERASQVRTTPQEKRRR